ncbi:hypothetical protein ISS37_00945 [candidate division KSB1 bacterium]|nr:hypothetical protein [candidate division KSB1 bacterium]
MGRIEKSLFVGIFLLMWAGLMTPGAPLAKSKWKLVRPREWTKKETLIIQGKKRTYYPLQVSKPVVVELMGPARLKIRSRPMLYRGVGGKVKNSYFYRKDDGRKKYKIETVSRKTNKVKSLGKKIPIGRATDTEIRVPSGVHTYAFYLEELQGIPVLLRFWEKLERKGAKFIAFTPAEHGDPISLSYREEELIYYRLTPEDPFRVGVIGPTVLKVMTRLEFDYRMRGEKKYRIQLSENGKVIATYPLRTIRSKVTEYLTEKDKIPGKGRFFLVNVPKRKHSYQIKLLDPDRSVLVRVMIPEEDAKNSL